MLGTPGLAPDADHELRAVANRIAADVEPVIQVVDDVHQADGVHVEHRGGVGIVAHLRRIAGDADQVANSQRARAQQVRLNAQHVAVAAGVVQDRLDADLLRHHQAQRLVAQSRRSARAVGNVDGIHAHRLQVARALDFLGARRCPWAERSPP